MSATAQYAVGAAVPMSSVSYVGETVRVKMTKAEPGGLPAADPGDHDPAGRV